MTIAERVLGAAIWISWWVLSSMAAVGFVAERMW